MTSTSPHARLLARIEGALGDPRLADVEFVLPPGKRMAVTSEWLGCPIPMRHVISRFVLRDDNDNSAGGGGTAATAAAPKAGATTVVLYAHKLVLGLSSPVFAAIFTSALAEGVASGGGGAAPPPLPGGTGDASGGGGGRTRIEIGADVGRVAFEAALRYIYTGVLPPALSTGAQPSERGVALACDLLQARV